MPVSTQPVALVTGASSGIGRAIARALVDERYLVFGTSRRAVPGEISGGVNLLPIDVTDDLSVDEGVASILTRAGRIDVLVNNAGLGIVGGALESSLDQALALFQTNFFGAIRMIQAVSPTMLQRRAGHIVNISSVLGFLPAPFMALYAASKHALNGYSRSLDHELREYGVRVTSIEPAYTATSFDKNAVAADRVDPAFDAGRRAIAQVLTEVMATADDPVTVANTVVRAIRRPGRHLLVPSGKLARRLSILNRFAPAALVDRAIRRQAQLSN